MKILSVDEFINLQWYIWTQAQKQIQQYSPLAKIPMVLSEYLHMLQQPHPQQESSFRCVPGI